jgi:hypothetical protein
VHDEIGYGDVFNYLRYLPMARARVGRLLLEVKPGLERLLAGIDGVDALLTRGPSPPPADYDLHVPLESLPHVFETTIDSVPPCGPPLRIGSSLRAEWRGELARLSGVRIGVVWAGNPASGLDRSRSCTLADLHPLASLEGIAWVSLQKDVAVDARAQDGFGAPILDLGTRFRDFADTAAAIAELDGVVAVETSVAHLAGLLDKPTFVLLSRWPAWRWLLERSDTPWYRSMTLFRQRDAGDWSAPVRELRDAISRAFGVS